MDDYVRTFDARGDSYNRAAASQPGAREEERAILLRLLRAGPEHIVCDVPAGGGYVADGLRSLVRDPAQLVCIEPSPAFAAALDPAYTRHVAPIDRWPLADASADRVASLAGLHHLEDPGALFREAARVLRGGGRIAVGDVLDGTAPARFLDGAVDRWSATGHRGRYLRRGELAEHLAAAGFTAVEEQHVEFRWRFADDTQMAQFCRMLFGMEKASTADVLSSLDETFAIERTRDGVGLPWSLLFGAAGRR